MSLGINKVILIGHVGASPSTNLDQSKTIVSYFPLAIGSTYKKNDEWIPKTIWVDIKCFGKLAETALKTLTKGSQIFIEGKLNINEWTNDAGIKTKKIEIIALMIRYLFIKNTVGNEKDLEQETNKESEEHANKKLPNRTTITNLTYNEESDVPF